MFDFRLVPNPAKLPECRPEAVLLKELAEELAFFNDYTPEDRYTNFDFAAVQIIGEIQRTRCLDLAISGLGVEWDGFFRHLDNIFPDILYALSDIRNRCPSQLVFYDAGRKLVFTPFGNGFYRIRPDGSEPNHQTETIAADCLQKLLEQAVAAFFRFARTAYPDLFCRFMLPYLQETEWAHLVGF